MCLETKRGKKFGWFCFLKEWWRERGFAVARGGIGTTGWKREGCINLAESAFRSGVVSWVRWLPSPWVHKRTWAQPESSCSTAGRSHVYAAWCKRSEIGYEGFNFACLLLLVSLSSGWQEPWHRNSIKQPFTAAKTSPFVCPKVKPIAGKCLNCLHLASFSNKLHYRSVCLMYSSLCNIVYKGRACALQGYYEEKY